MAKIASQPPIRTPSGGTTDQVFQPLADCGNGNPFFYHMFADDFSPYRATDYTVTATSTGSSVAAIPRDGGFVEFATGTTVGQISIQQAFASFTVNSQPKKVFVEARLQASTWTNANVTFVAGLINTGGTFASYNDGILIAISNGVIQIQSTVAGVTTSVVAPSNTVTLVPNSVVDVAYYITRTGDILFYVDTQLVGFVPQSNIGTTNGPQNAGAVARMAAPTLTSAVLTPIIGINQFGAAAGGITLDVDFFSVQKER